MTKVEEGRIKLTDEATKDKNLIEAGMATEVFCEMLTIYWTKTKTGKAIKKKLTEEEFICFFNGLAMSFISTIYVNASKDDEEFEKRMTYVNEITKDILAEDTIDA